MSQLTGIPVASYRRLERGQVENPPLRHLVNCALVLRVPVAEVIEDRWLKWLALSDDATAPPSKDQLGF